MSTQNVQDQLVTAVLEEAKSLLEITKMSVDAYFLSQRQDGNYELYKNVCFMDDFSGVQRLRSKRIGDVLVKDGKIVWPISVENIFSAPIMKQLGLAVPEQKADDYPGHVSLSADAMEGAAMQQNAEKTIQALTILKAAIAPLPEKITETGWYMRAQNRSTLDVVKVEPRYSPRGSESFSIAYNALLEVTNGVVNVNLASIKLYDIVQAATITALEKVDPSNSKHQKPVETSYSCPELRGLHV